MLNRYPLWKNLLLLFVVLIAIVYAMPNLYPDDPAVQVSHSSGELPENANERVIKALEEAGIAYKAIELPKAGPNPGPLSIRFHSPEEQLNAQEAVKSALDSRYIVALNLTPSTPDALRAISADPMSLGLDLRGGVHFLLQVDMDAAIEKALDRYEGDFRTTLRENKIRYLNVSQSNDSVVVKFRNDEDYEAGLSILKDELRNELEFSELGTEKGAALSARILEPTRRNIQTFALQQNIITLRKRVNELGVAEPVIQRQGEDRIVVQLPGVQDTARAKEILGATATLEFRLVNEQADPFAAQQTGQIPVGDKLYSDRDGAPILLKRRVMLTGDYITDAASGIDTDSGGPAVFITLDGKGARIFSKVTGENVKRLMAVVFLENKTERIKKGDTEEVRTTKTEEVINVARIQEQLSKRFQITGLDNTNEARKLALLLRAGALAAPMTIVEERTVGPSLGQQNIDQGQKSVVIGLILVMIFMALYYRAFGVVADIALALNLLLIVAIMSMIPGATLTLPGIAGIVLTVGMAVDANVLIFERIREELRNGNSPQASIHAGYGKALSTIADANITTLIAAIVLFAFGTGPIKGFAVTLSIGIVCSMFTAIFGTRAVINWIYGNKKAPVLAI